MIISIDSFFLRIVVYSPQVYENYCLQSGEGLSIFFVIIWLLGDVTNLAGALLGGLLPTVILLALYVSFFLLDYLSENGLVVILKYTACDLILLGQIYYYRYKRHRLSSSDSGEGQGEHTPLIGSEGQPPNEDALPAKILAIRYTCALAFIVCVGVVASWITNEDIDDDDDGNLHNPTEGTKKWWTIQLLGWSSAILFVRAQPRVTFPCSDSFPCPAGRPRAANMSELPRCAPTPLRSQTLNLVKNFKTRCEGLSPALFFYAIFGNTTYALSICAKSMDKEYLIKNGGWLAGKCGALVFYYYYLPTDMRVVGSALTVFLDVFVSRPIVCSWNHSFPKHTFPCFCDCASVGSISIFLLPIHRRRPDYQRVI
jgi:hypothetical protein